LETAIHSLGLRTFCRSFLLIALWALGSRASGVSITNVQVTETSLLVRGDAGAEPVSLVEIQAQESPEAATISNRPPLRAAERGPFEARLPRWDGDRDRAYSSFALIRNSDATPLGTNHFVEQWAGLRRSEEPFPTAASKKGLQVQMLDDALSLGVKHAALNVNLSSLVLATNESASLEWTNGGGWKCFFSRGRVEALDHQVKKLSDAGVLVSLIILTYESARPEVNRLMLHPLYDRKAPNHLAAFNSSTAEGVRQLGATMEFLTERYARGDRKYGHAVNFIIGNEVNSHWFWYNMGPATMEQVATDYLRAVRVCNTAVRMHSATARVYLSLEHHWNIRYPGGNERQAFAARPFLEFFSRSAKTQGDFEWNLAFHPYPENLFDCRTWRDKSATLRWDTPRITFRNLEMLTTFFERDDLRFHGNVRRVILSEQGFHSRPTEEGEQLQAAAYAYAFYRTSQLPGIDAFILHRHIDHPAEGGLNLGLWRRDNAGHATVKKPIYEVFRHADMPDWEQYFAFALPIIGIDRWDQVKPQAITAR